MRTAPTTDPWHVRSTRHFSTLAILRCAIFHSGSRTVLSQTAKVPDSHAAQFTIRLSFCAVCDRHIPYRALDR